MSRPLHHLIAKTDRLVVFDAVIRAGSFTDAALALGVTQPAVSRHIALLEDELQTVLFRRENNRAVPTRQAVKLAHHVDAGLTEFEVGLSEVRGRADVLTLAVQPAIAESWFTPRLAELRAALDPALVQLVIFEHDDELQTVDHDVSIRFGASFGRQFRSEKLIAESVAPVASPDFAGAHGLDAHSSPAELLAGPRLLHLDPARHLWMAWGDWFDLVGAGGPVPEPDLQHRNYGILIQQALAGQGVALGWRTLLGDLVRRELLVPVGPTVERPDLGYHLVWPPGLTRHRGRRRLRDWLVRVLADLQAGLGSPTSS